MTTVSVVLKPTTNHLPLPNINAGQSYALQFASGDDTGRDGSVKVFTDGPNIFALDGITVTDSTGAVVWTQGSGGNSVTLTYNMKPSDPALGKASLKANTVYTLNIPATGDGGARYDYQQPAPKH